MGFGPVGGAELLAYALHGGGRGTGGSLGSWLQGGEGIGLCLQRVACREGAAEAWMTWPCCLSPGLRSSWLWPSSRVG